MKIYLAGPLFSDAERDWMKKLKTQKEKFSAESGRTGHVIWPYELITQPELEQLGSKACAAIWVSSISGNNERPNLPSILYYNALNKLWPAEDIFDHHSQVQ